MEILEMMEMGILEKMEVENDGTMGNGGTMVEKIEMVKMEMV